MPQRYLTNLIAQDPEAAEQFEQVEYAGPNYANYVYSPTHVLRKFRIGHYGYYRNGATLWVHKDDIEADPTAFVRIPTLEANDPPANDPPADDPPADDPIVEEPIVEEPIVDETPSDGRPDDEAFPDEEPKKSRRTRKSKDDS